MKLDSEKQKKTAKADAPPDLIIHAFDRLTLQLSIAESPIPLEELKKHCTDVKATPKQMKFNARWKSEYLIRQPTPQCLILLSEALGYDVSVNLSYAEIAFDFLSSDETQACARRNHFLETAKFLHQRDPVVLSKEETTFYYGRRYVQKKRDGKLVWVRSPRVLATYADRPSKLLNSQPPEHGMPDSHTEIRLSGSPALAHVGLVSLTDLIEFDHLAFWQANLRFYRQPPKTQLGRLLGKYKGAKPAVTRSKSR